MKIINYQRIYKNYSWSITCNNAEKLMSKIEVLFFKNPYLLNLLTSVSHYSSYNRLKRERWLLFTGHLEHAQHSMCQASPTRQVSLSLLCTSLQVLRRWKLFIFDLLVPSTLPDIQLVFNEYFWVNLLCIEEKGPGRLNPMPRVLQFVNSWTSFQTLKSLLFHIIESP